MEKSELQVALEKHSIKTLEAPVPTIGRTGCLGVQVHRFAVLTVGQLMCALAMSNLPPMALVNSQLMELDSEVTGDANVLGLIYFPGVDYCP